MKERHKTSQSGFTIVEVLVTLAILSILGTVITSALVFVNKYNHERLSANHIERELYSIADHLEVTLESSQILYPESATTSVDSLVILAGLTDTSRYVISDGGLQRDTMMISVMDMTIDSLGLITDNGALLVGSKALYITLYASSGEKKYEVKRMARVTGRV